MKLIKLESFPYVQNKQADVPKKGNAHYLIDFFTTAKNKYFCLDFCFTLNFYYFRGLLPRKTLIF